MTENTKSFLNILSPSETKTSLVSRNIRIIGHRTSIRLEPEMWLALKDIALREKCSIHDLCSVVSMRKRKNASLTAAIRVFLMLYFRASSTEEGHSRAGHGSIEMMKRRARISDMPAPPNTRPHPVPMWAEERA
ncbi:MAG: ribbon-helix-helix domain-containing protein [Alphaproteobacteria bacterium]|nr:ribbon-helix-helix domain-containing protein [Alphaproteobacteria bacterium]